MKVAVVGATGLVGSKVLQVLAERNFPVSEIIPVASERSVGKEVEFKGKKYKVVSMPDGIAAKPDVAIFSAGGGTSLEWAPKFAEAGITVIDNSSAWRMDPTKKLVVPEINAEREKEVTGANGGEYAMAYKYPIDLNAIPQIDVFLENGYTKEEMKMVNETKKIMRDDSIRVTATTVRIPVMGGHSESVNVEFEKEFELADVRSMLEKETGIIVVDDP